MYGTSLTTSLHAGVDTSLIALWLGHVSVETTQTYLHADLELKEKPWPEPDLQKASPADTSHPTPCWPGSKTSDYADHASTRPPAHNPRSDLIGIIPRSA